MLKNTEMPSDPLWHFKDFYCVDFDENALLKGFGIICWPPLLLDELSKDIRDSDGFFSMQIVCTLILVIARITSLLNIHVAKWQLSLFIYCTFTKTCNNNALSDNWNTKYFDMGCGYNNHLASTAPAQRGCPHARSRSHAAPHPLVCEDGVWERDYQFIGWWYTHLQHIEDRLKIKLGL